MPQFQRALFLSTVRVRTHWTPIWVASRATGWVNCSCSSAESGRSIAARHFQWMGHTQLWLSTVTHYPVTLTGPIPVVRRNFCVIHSDWMVTGEESMQLTCNTNWMEVNLIATGWGKTQTGWKWIWSQLDEGKHKLDGSESDHNWMGENTNWMEVKSLDTIQSRCQCVFPPDADAVAPRQSGPSSRSRLVCSEPHSEHTCCDPESGGAGAQQGWVGLRRLWCCQWIFTHYRDCCVPTLWAPHFTQLRRILHNFFSGSW